MVERCSHAQRQQGSEAADGGAKQHHPVESVGGVGWRPPSCGPALFTPLLPTHTPVSPALQPPTACSCSTRSRARAFHPAATSRWALRQQRSWRETAGAAAGAAAGGQHGTPGQLLVGVPAAGVHHTPLLPLTTMCCSSQSRSLCPATMARRGRRRS